MLRVALCVLASVPVLFSLASGAAAMSRPCSWITADELGKALGTPVTQVEDRKNLMTEQPIGCRYHTGNVLKSAALDAYERSSAEDAQQYLTQLTQQAARLPGGNKNPITPVPGIGDEAAEVGHVLYVRKGAIVFSLAVFDGDQTTSPQSFAKAKSLAQAALPRI
jgi:hypothetical protein